MLDMKTASKTVEIVKQVNRHSRKGTGLDFMTRRSFQETSYLVKVDGRIVRFCSTRKEAVEAAASLAS